jgi:hypothetical protein
MITEPGLLWRNHIGRSLCGKFVRGIITIDPAGVSCTHGKSSLPTSPFQR